MQVENPNLSPWQRLGAALVYPRRTDFSVRRLGRHISTLLLLLVLVVEAGGSVFVMRHGARSSATVESMYNGSTVAEPSSRSMIRLIAVFGLGLLFGMVAMWAIQRTRDRGAVRLAKLQSDFVASVSHELRTPLTAILTAGENIRDGLAVGPDRLFEQGSVITDQASRLTDLVDQVLSFFASTKGNIPHALRELRVDEVIAHALRATKWLLEESHCTVEPKIKPDLPPVTADLALLSQCLQNLIVNAVKYSNGNPWIGISAEMNEQKTEVQISVQDHGIGIPSDDQPRIFEPFYRSPQVASSKIRGTGLGLAIAKRGVEAFGGELTVSSRVGAGSTFTLHLPCGKQGAAPDDWQRMQE